MGEMFLTNDESASGPAAVAQLLDEHHLVVLSDTPTQGGAFARSLAEHLMGLPETQVLHLHGGRIRDLDSACRELQRALRDRRRLAEGLEGLIRLLRRAPVGVKRQYFVWEDADTLLESDVEAFGRVANTMFSIAAEREQLNPDLLVLQRFIFIGNDKLGAYAEDEHGQFRAWKVEDDDTEFWEVMSCVDRPPVLTYRLNG